MLDADAKLDDSAPREEVVSSDLSSSSNPSAASPTAGRLPSLGDLSHRSRASATSATSYFELPPTLPKDVVLELAKSTAGNESIAFCQLRFRSISSHVYTV